MQQRGRLTVVGTIDIKQFWPSTKGSRASDGDTIHLKVDPASFLFAKSAKAKPHVVNTFIGAFVLGPKNKKTGEPKHTQVITAKSEIKIRLQGIDTPELHFPVITKPHPSKKGKTDFRQPYGASAASALLDYLKVDAAPGSTFVHATFVTNLDLLHNAVDVHGRFVGDILVGTSSGKSINKWLVEEGWAYPLFYDTMTEGEIRTILDAWKTGKLRAKRPGKSLKRNLQPFDPIRTVDNAKLPDGGPLNYPKIFRRQATFWKQVAGPLTGAEFAQMLAKGAPNKIDKAYTTDYFLKNIDHLNPAKRIWLVDKIGSNGQMLFEPENLVFKEDQTRLFGADGTEIKI